MTSTGPSWVTPYWLLSQVDAGNAEFRRKTRQFLGDRVLTAPLKMHVVDVVGGSGEESMAAVEMKADALCRNGEFGVTSCYNLFFSGDWLFFFSLSPFLTLPPCLGGPVHVLSLDDR
jgi:hypothetical protein